MNCNSFTHERQVQQSWCTQITRRKEDDFVKRETMLGYPLKVMGNRWCETVFMLNMSAQRLRECRDAHQAVVGYNVFKRRSMLLPTGWLDIVVKYEQLYCIPLSLMMHATHVVRFMLLDGGYAFSPKCLDASSGAAIDQTAMDSYRRNINVSRCQWGMCG